MRGVGLRQGAGGRFNGLGLYRGTTENPTYPQVTAGGTGHYEAVEITYDPSRVSYDALLTAYWHSVDPTDDGGQFCDRGHSYKTAVFVNEEQRQLAEDSRQAAQRMLDQPIVTPILASAPFYAAEDYHQDYYEKNPVRYRFYRFSCGRDRRVKEVWGERLGRACLPRVSRGTDGEKHFRFAGGPRWDRTSDTLIKSQVLYH